MMGIESNGMVLAASPDGGAPIVLNAEPGRAGHACSLTPVRLTHGPSDGA